MKDSLTNDFASPARFTLKQLHHFVLAARCGQISLAAGQAHITQSAMTTSIAELERVLGSALFDRGRSGIRLTHDGHLFLQHAQNVLDTAAEATRYPFRRHTDIVGRLEVAASYTVLGYFLLPTLARFRTRFPLVDVVPLELTRQEIEKRLRRNKLALAVVLVSNLDDKKGVSHMTLARSRRQLWVSSQHVLTQQPTATMADIAQHPYILPMVDEGDKNALLYWQQSGVKPRELIRTSSMEALREMVALGLGVTILSDMVFRPWSLDGRRIATVQVNHPIPPMEIGLAWPSNEALSPAAQAFKDFLAVSFGGSSNSSREV
jgi:DNA-binding transcriptional LysR family regulator